MFRYDRRLRTNDQVKELVQATWNSYLEAQVSVRISHCRRAIAEWSRSQYLNSRKIIERLRHSLDVALSAQIADDSIISSLNTALLQAYRKEEYWKQRSRQLWLTLGDKNTAYFHAATKGRRARNRISVLEDSNGQIFYEEAQIVETIATYFKEIFTSTNNNCASTVNNALGCKVTEEMNNQLIQTLSAAEIR